MELSRCGMYHDGTSYIGAWCCEVHGKGMMCHCGTVVLKGPCHGGLRKDHATPSAVGAYAPTPYLPHQIPPERVNNPKIQNQK